MPKPRFQEEINVYVFFVFTSMITFEIGVLVVYTEWFCFKHAAVDKILVR